MTIHADAPGVRSISDRIKGILLTPKAEWARIAEEPATIGGLFKGYAAPLAAIGPICSAIGALLFGWGALGFVYHPPILSVIVNAIVGYLLALGSVFVLGLIIEALAPNFGGVKDRSAAMKAAVYSATASWLVGVAGLLPALAPLALLGLYSLYLLYTGLPRLMRTPEDKALAYTAVVIVVAIVLGIVVGVLLIPLRTLGGLGAAGAYGPSTAALGGRLNVGGGSVDLGKLQAASAALQAQAALRSQAVQNADAPAAAGGPTLGPDALKALLPTSIGGFARQDISTDSGGTAGVGVAHAQASYAKGDAHMTVEITDMAAIGALGAVAGAFNVNSSKETATGYEKASSINGRLTTEEFDRASNHGKFSVLAGGHVMIEASGDGVTMDDLKSAVGAVGVDRVEALTHHV